MDRKGDYFGEVFLLRGCTGDDSGEIITPESIVRSDNDAIIQQLEPNSERWQRVIDAAARTGRYLVNLSLRCGHGKVALFGVEPDLDLYRACLLNMRLYAWNRPYFILNGDPRVIDVSPRSPNLRYANVWCPPDWRSWVRSDTYHSLDRIVGSNTCAGAAGDDSNAIAGQGRVGHLR